MLYDDALNIATTIKDTLAPYCVRIEIAGAIRRHKSEVSDIKIVCIPKRSVSTVAYETLFGGENIQTVEKTSPEFVQCVNKWHAVKGKPEGKFTQRIFDGITLKLFMCYPHNWGLVLAIHTATLDFSHRVLAKRWCKMGYECEDGTLFRVRGTQKPEPVFLYEEADLFNLLQLKPVPPENMEVK